MLFEVALLNGHDSIVLSAWGCGAYNCPPEKIANLFKKEIEHYKLFFKSILFAIKVCNEKDLNNFHTFYRIINQ